MLAVQQSIQQVNNGVHYNAAVQVVSNEAMCSGALSLAARLEAYSLPAEYIAAFSFTFAVSSSK